MSSATSVFSSSIGRKLIMSLSGLFLVTFLIVHLSGNLLLFKTDGGQAFNAYTQFMSTNPLIRVAEWIMFLGFIIHILYAYRLTSKNNHARPTKYAYKKDGENSSWMSRNMGLTGSIIFIFLAVHLVMFWGQYHWGSTDQKQDVMQIAEYHWKVAVPAAEGIDFPDGTSIENGTYLTKETALALRSQGITELKAVSMYHVVKRSFSQWWIVLFYVVAMMLIAFHLSHGFQSAFRSTGAVHSKYTPTIRKIGVAFSIIVPLGFALIPIYYLINSMG